MSLQTWDNSLLTNVVKWDGPVLKKKKSLGGFSLSGMEDVDNLWLNNFILQFPPELKLELWANICTFL